jgi:hypothetical protein
MAFCRRNETYEACHQAQTREFGLLCRRKRPPQAYLRETIYEEILTKDLIKKNQTEKKTRDQRLDERRIKKTRTKDKKYLPLSY